MGKTAECNTMKVVTSFLAWLRGTKWARNNFGGYVPPDRTKQFAEAYARDLQEIRESLAITANRMNTRREAEVMAGNFLYYVVSEGSNVRKMYDGVPIIYASQEAAEEDDTVAGFRYEEVISVAAYNRLYRGLECQCNTCIENIRDAC